MISASCAEVDPLATRPVDEQCRELPCSCDRRWLPLAVVGWLVALAPLAGAQEIWSGRTYVFEKADYADWTQPENQDRLTERVWITRVQMQDRKTRRSSYESS